MYPDIKQDERQKYKKCKIKNEKHIIYKQKCIYLKRNWE